MCDKEFKVICSAGQSVANSMKCLGLSDPMGYERVSRHPCMHTPPAAALFLFLQRLWDYEPEVALMAVKYACFAVMIRAQYEAQWELNRCNLRLLQSRELSLNYGMPMYYPPITMPIGFNAVVWRANQGKYEAPLLSSVEPITVWADTAATIETAYDNVNHLSIFISKAGGMCSVVATF